MDIEGGVARASVTDSADKPEEDYISLTIDGLPGFAEAPLQVQRGVPRVISRLASKKRAKKQHISSQPFSKRGTQKKQLPKGSDLMLVRSHRHMEFWKDKYATEMGIYAELDKVNAAVALFDKQSIQTVVPQRYMCTERRSQRRGTSFPGHLDPASNLGTIKRAYQEHTDAKRDPSRLVLWSDGSSRGPLHGFAITWRRSLPDSWAPWEAAGFKVATRGRDIDSGSVEVIAVIRSLEKAREIACKAPELKSVVIYTDSSTSIKLAGSYGKSYGKKMCGMPKMPKKAKRHVDGMLIIKKARRLRQMGLAISLHWCPGHSGVPGNELADKIASIAGKHTYGTSKEIIDLSDDDEDNEDEYSDYDDKDSVEDSNDSGDKEDEEVVTVEKAKEVVIILEDK